MDDNIYSAETIKKFLNEHLLFRDEKLKKYFERNLQRDFEKFRTRLRTTHGDKTLEKMMYVLVTDSIRDIILDTIGELTQYLQNSGDLIISGGEAFNLYVEFKDRIVTSDIDAKFVPRLPMNSEYFGKLQALKLLLWNKMGELAKRLNLKIKKRIMDMKKRHPQIFKYMGVGFQNNGPYVTRRYSLIKKKKGSEGPNPTTENVFIDVELFALDLNIRYYSPKSGKIENHTMGGILDIPFMRPREFGYEVGLTKRRGMTYRDVGTGKLVNDKRILVASKEFLIEDIYLMQKLKLRPEKREKDRQRLLKLARLFDKKIIPQASMNDIFKKIVPKISGKVRSKSNPGKVSMNNARRVDPYKYKNFTTKPSEEKLSKQIVYGLKPTINGTTVNGYTKSHGGQRFNTKKLQWIEVNNINYLKNEFPLRLKNGKSIPKNINITNTLYGYNPRRNVNVPKNILNKSAAIPFVGLKK
jgi:hypothetical protein